MAHIKPNDLDNYTPCSAPATSRPVAVAFFRSSSSISSGSSSVSLYESSPFSSPDTPLQFSRVAFSWEQLPGISKKGIIYPKMKDNSLFDLLPPPPARNSSSSEPKRKQRDPFFIALMECSKDDDDYDDHGHGRSSSLGNVWKGLKVSKGKIGIIGMYTSCKKSCDVSESVVYIPRSRPYNLVNRRSS